MPASAACRAVPRSGPSWFAEGEWWSAGSVAAIPARLLGRAGSAIDACAAPGGKTMQLAAAGWEVTAIDASESRLARLRDNLARTHLTAEIVAADVAFWSPPAPVDAVLLDAPCSATGIFRRHPDVLHRVHPAIIEEAAHLQRQLLVQAAGWVKKGGKLVYATCSLEREEGEEQARRFAVANPFHRPGLRQAAGDRARSARWIRILPGALAARRLRRLFIARSRGPVRASHVQPVRIGRRS